MVNLLITLVVPILISSYFVYQISMSRGSQPLGWLAINAFLPFIPLIYFILNSGPKPTSPYAQGLQENALYSAPISVRFSPDSSRSSIKGWVYLTQQSLYWLPLESHTSAAQDNTTKTYVGSLQWDLKEVSVEQKRIYKDGIVNLLLLPAPVENAPQVKTPVALVLGTGFELSRLVGIATIISRSQDNWE